MKRLIDALFVVLLIGIAACDTSRNVDSPYDNYFLKYYGGDGFQVAADLLPLADGNYLLLGTSTLSGNLTDPADSRIYLVLVDSHGSLLSETFWGDPGDVAKDIEETVDGDFIILADHQTTSTNTDIKLLKVSYTASTNTFVKADSVVYGSSAIENARTVSALENGEFVITGDTKYTSIILNPNNPEDKSDIFHYRATADLDIITFNWYEQEGPGTLDYGVKSIRGVADTYYVFGSSNQLHEGNADEKLNLYYSWISAGGIITKFNFLGDFDVDTESAFVGDVPLSLGGGYLFVGSKLYPTGAVTLHATRLRADLTFTSADEIWDREIPIDARNLRAVSGAAVGANAPGFLILANETAANGSQNIWLTKVDLNGNLMWSRAFGSQEDDDFGAAVTATTDGHIMMLGTVNLINGQSKLTLFKLNEEGQLKE